MRKVAIICGGYSSESEISKKSALTLYNHLDKNAFDPYIVEMDRLNWQVKHDNQFFPIDKNDFSFEKNGQKEKFDFVYITIHGTPGEDGKLQGYFDMLKVPYVNSGVMASSLTFNKWACNQFLKSFGIPIAESYHLKLTEKYTVDGIVEKVGLPCFVKPNDGGSSYGITKVKKQEEIERAIQLAFQEGEEVIIEAFLDGPEITCGVYRDKENINALPVTQIVTHNEFFDYKAKYEGLSEEITPAPIEEDLKNRIQLLSKKIYEITQVKCFVRIDYIVVNNTPHVIEVNTTPGMSPASIIPQQVKADGKDLKDVLTQIILTTIG